MFCFTTRRTSITAIFMWSIISMLCTLPLLAAATPIDAREAAVITNNRRCMVRACMDAKVPPNAEAAPEAEPVSFAPEPAATPAAEVPEPVVDVAAPTSGAFGRAQISPLLAFTAASFGGAILAVF